MTPRDRLLQPEPGPGADEARLARYLLGQLPADERLAVEESLFADAGVLDELNAVGDDLIHAYLAGGLAPEQRAGFEAHFLTVPRHRRRLEFVRDLVSAVHDVEREDRPAPAPAPGGFRLPRWAPAAAAVVAASGILAALVLRRADPGSRQATSPPSVAAAPSLAAGPPSASARPAEVQVLRLPRHAGGPVAVAVAPATRWLRVEVAVDPEAPSFDASVRARGGGEVWRAEGILAPPAGRPLVLSLPARLLALGEYLLLVQGESLREGESPLQEYALRVRRAEEGGDRPSISASPR